MYRCVCFYLPDQRRSALSFFTMGSSCSNHLGIPPGNGPNAVGCTDFMMDHTAEVQAKENLCSCWHVTAEVTYLYLTFLSVLQMLGWVPTGIMESWHHGSKWPSAELLELAVCLANRAPSSGCTIPVRRRKVPRSLTGSHARSTLTVWLTSWKWTGPSVKGSSTTSLVNKSGKSSISNDFMA